MELVGGRSVINGAYPSIFFLYVEHMFTLYFDYYKQTKRKEVQNNFKKKKNKRKKRKKIRIV